MALTYGMQLLLFIIPNYSHYLALKSHWIPLMVLSAVICRNSLETYIAEKPRNLGMLEEEGKGCGSLRGCVGPNGSWELDMRLSEKRNTGLP